MDASQPVAVRRPTFSLNIEEAVRAIFRDPDWPKKLALGSLFYLLTMLVIGIFFVQGYLLAYGERVARAEPRPLPEWDDFGELLRKGFLGIVVSLVYSIPIFAVVVAIGLLLIPLFVAASSSSANADTLGGIFVLGYCGALAILLPLGIILSLVVPAAHAQLILHNHDLAAAFRFGEVFGFIRRQPGQYALMSVLALAANAGLAQIGQLACFVGIFFTAFLAQLFQYHLLGQLCWYERIMRTQLTVVP